MSSDKGVAHQFIGGLKQGKLRTLIEGLHARNTELTERVAELEGQVEWFQEHTNNWAKRYDELRARIESSMIVYLFSDGSYKILNSQEDRERYETIGQVYAVPVDLFADANKMVEPVQEAEGGDND